MTTYFVRNGGSDGADGLSDATAWASVSKVNGASLAAGDVVQFKRGSTFTQTLIPKSGVTYQDYGSGNKPVIDDSDNYGVDIRSKSDITLKNIAFNNNPTMGAFVESSNRIRFDGCSFDGNGTASSTYSIRLNNSHDCELTNCAFTNCVGADHVFGWSSNRLKIVGCTFDGPGPNNGDNVHLGGCSNLTIEDCVFTGSTGGKGHVIVHCRQNSSGGPLSTGGIIRNCDFFDGNWGIAPYQPNLLIEGCRFVEQSRDSGTSYGGIWMAQENGLPSSITGITIQNCLFDRPTAGIHINNNRTPANWGFTVKRCTFIGQFKSGYSAVHAVDGTLDAELSFCIFKDITQTPAYAGGSGGNTTIGQLDRHDNFYENVTNAPFGEPGSRTGNAQLDVNFIPESGSPAENYGWSGRTTPPPSGEPNIPEEPPPADGRSALELMAIATDPDFLVRVEFMAAKVARTVANESTGTADHDVRLQLARRVLTRALSFRGLATHVLHDQAFRQAMLTASTGGTAGTDADLETAIDAQWTALAKTLR